MRQKARKLISDFREQAKKCRERSQYYATLSYKYTDEGETDKARQAWALFLKYDAQCENCELFVDMTRDAFL